MRQFLIRLLGGHLQVVLITSLVFVAMFTVTLNAVVISRAIKDYLSTSQVDRISRDQSLADGLFEQKLSEVQDIGESTVTDPQIVVNLPRAVNNDPYGLTALDQLISRKITAPQLGSSQAILVLDRRGNVLAGRTLLASGQLSTSLAGGNWGSLPIVVDALSSARPMSGTEVIPVSLLAQMSLDQQAHIILRQTTDASAQPYDAREGSAGLALMSVYPLLDNLGSVQGMVVTAYLFNNDFSFVDFMTKVAKIETATIFLGDLRVSTNVLNTNGTRAVGTRVSQAVYNQVLLKGQIYAGRAFVVNDWYFGNYVPLHDHRNKIVGMIYVGERESDFTNLVDTFTYRVAFIALICLAVAGVIAIPIARLIVRPIIELVDANRHLERGDMSVRVHPAGSGEIALLGRSFNSMVETLEETQRALAQKEKLASMGQLAAGVAHELNNPLGTILLYSDVMYRDAAEDDQRREDLKMIIDEAYRCKTIVADLLNFARDQEIMVQDTNLNALITNLVEKSRRGPRFGKLELVCLLDQHLPIIHADPAQLEQAFINIINNSADAIEDSGTITISTSVMRDHTVEIRISDTGSGIAPENLDKLFTPFFTTKPVGKGTGLGLAIVYGIIKIHRGQIQVESHLGEGTTIIITLPISQPARQGSASDHKTDFIG
jgi:two-component system NtrC family sensor kinase